MPTTTPTRLSWRLVGDVLFRHWGIKTMALLLAAVLFVSTRNEVTRAFEIPIRVVQDPDRVVLTDLPETIQVQVRGPWTRINRLQPYDFGVATLDLRSAQPGPLEIDRASIVMPAGVVLAAMHYDHVDLRFEPVLEREVPIEPVIVGEPADDYRLIRIETDPPRWAIRGGQSKVQQVRELATEPLDVSDATQDVVGRLAVVRPSPGVSVVSAGGEAPTVEVRAVVGPVEDRREVAVPVVVPDGLDPTGVIPNVYAVEVSGPLPAIRRLDGAGIPLPIEAELVVLEGETADGGRVVEIRFSWAETVPVAIREALKLDHGAVRVSLPAPGAAEAGRDEQNRPAPP